MFSSEIARMRKLGIQGVSSRAGCSVVYPLTNYFYLLLSHSTFSLSLCVYVCTVFHSLVSCHELVFTFISITTLTLRNIPNLLLWNNHTMHQWGGKIDAFPNTQPLNGSGLGAYDVERSLSAYEFRKSDRRCPLVRLLISLALSFKRCIWADNRGKTWGVL